ncbi:MAG: FHA domain-containing protein, partial [Chloroflexota bacterium]
VVLPGRTISAEHVRLSMARDQLWLEDLDSRNGTLLNGQPVNRKIPIKPSDEIMAGNYLLQAEFIDTTPENRVPVSFQPEIVTESLINQAYPTAESHFLTVGGGIGSFVWADALIVSGVDPDNIVAIGLDAKPYGRYQRLCANSQIPDHERLRSNSDSCPDNMWGWPGYAVREIGRDAARGRLGQASRVAWQIFNEPYVQTYTPKAGDVFASMDKEAKRIGWENIWQYGRVRAIRKTDQDRYAVLYTGRDSLTGKRQSMVYYCNWLHVAIGYPGIKLLKQLQDFRDVTHDFHRLVNAYEEHDHVYDMLKEHGGTVVIRGRGIVASRIIQRIYEIRQESDKPIEVVHLMRSPKTKGQRFRLGKRDVAHNWEFQPFNWPKAAWGGDLRVTLERAGSVKRDNLLDQWGGTTTADRSDWKEIVDQGLAEGWYRIVFDNIKHVSADHPEFGPITLKLQDEDGQSGTILANYIVDATGLDSSIESHSLLHDLVGQYNLPLNPKGRLHVSNSFELEDMRLSHGQMYASGVSTLGGPYAPVDSFLGLQYAAQRSVSHLARHAETGVRELHGLRSFYQWTRWVRGVQP